MSVIIFGESDMYKHSGMVINDSEVIAWNDAPGEKPDDPVTTYRLWLSNSKIIANIYKGKSKKPPLVTPEEFYEYCLKNPSTLEDYGTCETITITELQEYVENLKKDGFTYYDMSPTIPDEMVTITEDIVLEALKIPGTAVRLKNPVLCRMSNKRVEGKTVPIRWCQPSENVTVSLIVPVEDLKDADCYIPTEGKVITMAILLNVPGYLYGAVTDWANIDL